MGDGAIAPIGAQRFAISSRRRVSCQDGESFAPGDMLAEAGARQMTRRRKRLHLALLTLSFAFIPNNPATFWYVVPEVVCGWWFTGEDQWRCDMEPVAPP